MAKVKQFFSAVGDFFYFNVWTTLKDKYYDTTWFFHNLKTFWKTLCDFRDWDYEYIIDVYVTCLEQLAKSIINGPEEKRSANKKVAMIREVIRLLKADVDEEYLKKYEEQLKNNEITYTQVFNEANTQRRKNLQAAFNIIIGQDPEKFDKKYQNAITKWTKKHNNQKPDRYEIWLDLYDGSGIENWWE